MCVCVCVCVCVFVWSINKQFDGSNFKASPSSFISPPFMVLSTAKNNIFDFICIPSTFYNAVPSYVIV